MTKAKIQSCYHEMVRPIVQWFHSDRIILFGSYAKGETTDDSDLDLLIVMPVEGSRHQKTNEIDLALADRLVPLNLIVITPDQFDQQKDVIGTIVREAFRVGKFIDEQAA